MMAIQRDRRVNRSHDVVRALEYQLDACRTAANAEAVVLTDETGLCLASAGPRHVCEEVAAHAPLVGASNGQKAAFSGDLPQSLMTRAFFLLEEPLFVAALIANDAELRPESTMEELSRTAAGAARILRWVKPT